MAVRQRYLKREVSKGKVISDIMARVEIKAIKSKQPEYFYRNLVWDLLAKLPESELKFYYGEGE